MRAFESLRYTHMLIKIISPFYTLSCQIEVYIVDFMEGFFREVRQ
jgi:hypothetical protein